jgi:hypothetical protein
MKEDRNLTAHIEREKQCDDEGPAWVKINGIRYDRLLPEIQCIRSERDQLRADLLRVNPAIEKVNGIALELGGELKEARAQLAERDALIADAVRILDDYPWAHELHARLSAVGKGQPVPRDEEIAQLEKTLLAAQWEVAALTCQRDEALHVRDLAREASNRDPEAKRAAEHAAARQIGSCGVALISAERGRQIAVEGWTPEHDDAHQYREIARAAIAYACAAAHPLIYSRTYTPSEWPWEFKWWKPSPDPIRNLVKAGALLAAEIDRLKRAAEKIADAACGGLSE